MNKELSAVVMPTGTLQLEWSDTTEIIGKSSRLLQEEIYGRFSADLDSSFWLLLLGFSDKQITISPSLGYWRDFASLFAEKLSQTPDLETIRDKAEVAITDTELHQALDRAPMMTGSEYLHKDILEHIWARLNHAFCVSIHSYDGSVEDFIKTLSPAVHLVGRVFFHLVENEQGNQPFAFLATYSTRLNKDGASKHIPLKYALQEYGDDSNKMLELLATVHAAAAKSALLSGLVETGELFHPLAWSSGEAYAFLREIPLYEESGILCRIPNWWRGKKSSIRLNIAIGDSKPSLVGMDAILSFNARLLLGDTDISEEEARKLLQESEGLAYIKNKWVDVDPERLKQTLDAYEKAKKMMDKNGLSMRDALRMQLNPEQALDLQADDEDTTVSTGIWLESVIQKLRNPDLTPAANPGKDFKAKLRPYQQEGLNWLAFLHSLGFGACLADDMGLGKTVQLLGFLSAVKSRQGGKASLLVIPASLISNWANEIERFLPTLKFFVAHPDAHPGKMLEPQEEKALDQLDLVITTYALVQKYEWLQSYSWAHIVLDEAQAIKNPGAKQTQAIKKLNAANRIVMTGTPIENRVSDLWSLFDFVNPGLLGNKTEFAGFAKTLRANPDGYARLRKVVNPYILRRLKTDRTVISDLPDKVEMKTYATLTKKQVVFYENMVRKLAETIAESDGIQRKGLVLSSLMKFKQLCNHPDQYLGTGEYAEAESGKFARLREICETIYEKREKVLVFTQFKEITAPLFNYLETIFQRKGLILHGSVPVVKRKKIIEQFQDTGYAAPYMVLSLKAGGVGLNLTEANHVIHFDRWWNPAVENQATDRAFRIGQTKNVIVHKFLTRGTVEEKIDKMLEQKTKLSMDVIASSGEAWITELGNNELMEVFRLTL
ncbi:MAG: DEAD/DEAH box helicase [Pseudomonadota bacterium]